ncbi:MAG: site-2 protease family protein [Acidobacteriota bacterium]
MNGTENRRQQQRQRQIRNLNAVYAHLKQDGQSGPQAAQKPASESRWMRYLKRWGPAGLAAAFLLGKFKWVVALLKFAKLHTLVSMLVTVWAYALFWGLPFAVGFVLLIFVHEMGHALVMRQQGIRAGAPVFIPFVGAVIAMKGIPRNAWVEALVGIGGPALGTLGAAACLAVAWLSGSLFWYALASVGFLINLFNMIPISPLDGGRIVGVISRWLWAAGYAVGIGVFFITYSPILFLVLLLGLFNLKQVIRGPRDDYFDVPMWQRQAMGAAYFGLMALMALGMWAADIPLAVLHQR